MRGSRVIRFWVAMLCAAAWFAGPVLAQSGVGVEVASVEDNRVKAGPFSASLQLKLTLVGNDIEKVDSSRVLVKTAKDDKGNDLLGKADPPDFQGREYNMGEMAVSLANPARAAKSMSVAGTVELFVPSKDPNAVVKIDKFTTKLDKPLTAKQLKAEKMTITLLSPKMHEEKRGAVAFDESKVEEIRERGKAEGVDEKEIEAMIELARAFQELGGGGTPPEGAVILSGKEADMDRILRVRLLAADGTELSIPSRSSSTSDGETIMVIEPSEPPPADAVLELTLLTKKATMSVPFTLNDIALP